MTGKLTKKAERLQRISTAAEVIDQKRTALHAAEAAYKMAKAEWEVAYQEVVDAREAMK